MEESTSLVDYMIALLLHDVGKAIFRDNDEFAADHKFLLVDEVRRDHPRDTLLNQNEIRQFVNHIPLHVIDLIKSHHESASTEKPWNLMDIAVVIADRLEKAMHQVTDEQGISYEDSRYEATIKRIRPFKKNPPYYPFYGNSIQSLKSNDGIKILLNANNEFNRNGKLSLNTALNLQKHFLHFPHTSYIPHVSLASHQRFTAAIFYLIYLKLVELEKQNLSPDHLTNFKFSLVHIIPQPLSMLYRLKDVTAEADLVNNLRAMLFEELFANDERFKPLFGDGNSMGIAVNANPFEFSGAGSILLIYPDIETVQDTIKKILLQNSIFPAINLFEFDYAASLMWRQSRDDPEVKELSFVSPSEVKPVQYQVVGYPNYSDNFLDISLGRCLRCSVPADDIEDGLCPACKEILDQELKIDLEGIAKDTERRVGKLGFVILKIDDLFSQAKSVAEKRLLPQLKDEFLNRMKTQPTEQKAIEYGRTRKVIRSFHSAPKPEVKIDIVPPNITPSETGIFEFLQAVAELEKFREELKSESSGVYEIQTQPEMMIWVMNKDDYYPFLALLFEKSYRLNIPHRIYGLICPRRDPFWSIMDRITSHKSIDEQFSFFHVSGGKFMAFTDYEVKEIRNLAGEAPDQVRTQLDALGFKAEESSLQELLLEIDKRIKRGRLPAEWSEHLKLSLTHLELTGNEEKNREKRAEFLRNIKDLIE